jgi:hypothetical protein
MINKTMINNKNEYGSARFATKKEIKKYFKKEKISNIKDIGFPIMFDKNLKTVWFDKGHSLMLGFIAYTKKQEFILSNEVDLARWVKDIDVYKTLFPDCEGNAAFATYKEYLKKKNIK